MYKRRERSSADARARRVARLYAKTEDLQQRAQLLVRQRYAQILIKGVFDGIWLGCVGDRGRAAIDRHHYESQKQYVDRAYNESGLGKWEAAALEEHFRGRRRVVISAAGGGREVLALLAMGFDAVGYEPNRELREFGQALLVERGYQGRLRASARDVWPHDAAACDAVVIGWGSYSLIEGSARRVKFLRGARSALVQGAPILLSFLARPDASFYFGLVKAVGSSLRRASMRPALELGDSMMPNYLHHFDRARVERELLDAGFELLAYDDREYGWAVAAAV